MRTAPRETVPQIVPRNCSREVGENNSMYVILVKGGGVHTIKHTFSEKVSASLVTLSASHQKQSSP